MMSIRALVVDDEPLARQSVRRFLKNHSDIQMTGECGDGQSAVTAILRHQPDLVFLDVQMPEMDGFEVVNAVGADRMPVTIFVTAYDQYALRAFDANALDYLLKPFGMARFERALARARERILGNAKNVRQLLGAIQSATACNDYPERMAVSENGRILFVNVRDIRWIEAAGNYAHLHLPARCYDVRETLSRLEVKLNPKQFARIHRSTIVNLEHVKEVHPWFHGYHLVLLEGGQKLRMSRYQRDVFERLNLNGRSTG